MRPALWYRQSRGSAIRAGTKTYAGDAVAIAVVVSRVAGYTGGVMSTLAMAMYDTAMILATATHPRVAD